MEQLKRDPKLHKKLFALLKALNIMHLREELARQFSDGRTVHVLELSDQEFKALVNKLSWQQEQQKPKHSSKQYKKLLAVAANLGWTTEAGIDFQHLQSWIDKYGAAKKPISKLSDQEMRMLVTQLEKVLKDHEEGQLKNLLQQDDKDQDQQRRIEDDPQHY
jgi:ABC-type phosphate transport system auxiliary subunit